MTAARRDELYLSLNTTIPIRRRNAALRHRHPRERERKRLPPAGRPPPRTAYEVDFRSSRRASDLQPSSSARIRATSQRRARRPAPWTCRRSCWAVTPHGVYRCNSTPDGWRRHCHRFVVDRRPARLQPARGEQGTADRARRTVGHGRRRSRARLSPVAGTGRLMIPGRPAWPPPHRPPPVHAATPAPATRRSASRSARVLAAINARRYAPPSTLRELKAVTAVPRTLLRYWLLDAWARMLEDHPERKLSCPTSASSESTSWRLMGNDGWTGYGERNSAEKKSWTSPCVMSLSVRFTEGRAVPRWPTSL